MSELENNSRKKAQEIAAQVNRAILGKEKMIEEVFLAFLADGHVLLEDVPGVGKTTLALAFSRAMHLECRRVQFTPDVMPSDLTGFSIYRREEERFVYQPGSVFCNLLLADEINRTSPKTQSALLEVMEERKVSVEGVTRDVPEPFLVIATQNPEGSAGTQKLPESQLDRFMISASLGYPDFEEELEMVMTAGRKGRSSLVTPVAEKEELLRMQEEVQAVYLKDTVCRYLLELIRATRDHARLERGASPRAAAALAKIAKAQAWYRGRDYVEPADVAEQFPYVVSHRIVRNTDARAEGITGGQIIKGILESVKKPPAGERKR